MIKKASKVIELSNKLSATTSLEQEEHYSLERMKKLYVNPLINQYDNISISISDIEKMRPQASFIELMNWVEKHFSFALSDEGKIEKLVHNRILIDGQFMQFCKEKNIDIRCLYKDSTVSWKSENGFEKFFAQGVFLVSNGKYKFLTNSLYHKGNQNEDEISFFTLVGEKSYNEYISLRNEFDAWVLKRDRANLHIRVVDGEDLPYTRDQSWDDLFLPESIKTDVKQLVESFINNKDFYKENNIPWKRGILMFGKPGNGKTSIIRTIISNYNFKPVTIAPGASDEALREAFSYAEEQSPSLLYIEDLDSCLDKTIDTSSFLNLMDGISAKNGLLVIATANDVSKLKTNITDRPSRFDRKFEVPLPDVQMSSLYIKKWFKNFVDAKKIKELATHAVRYNFSYAYLKELYISSMFEALANGRKVPLDKDINKALDRLMKDKSLIKSGKSISTSKYFDK